MEAKFESLPDIAYYYPRLDKGVTIKRQIIKGYNKFGLFKEEYHADCENLSGCHEFKSDSGNCRYKSNPNG